MRGRKYRVAPIALGTNTDPYQPCEAEHRLMRGILELLSNCQHPCAITTKGALIERDLDLLSPMAALGLVRVGISLTTLDAALARRMEPRAPIPRPQACHNPPPGPGRVQVRVMIAPSSPA